MSTGNVGLPSNFTGWSRRVRDPGAPIAKAVGEGFRIKSGPQREYSDETGQETAKNSQSPSDSSANSVT